MLIVHVYMMKEIALDILTTELDVIFKRMKHLIMAMGIGLGKKDGARLC